MANDKYEQYEVVEDLSDDQIVIYIRSALQSAFTDDVTDYSRLIGMLHYDERRITHDDIALLVTSLKALSGAARSIDSVQHGDLLTTILNMSLWHYYSTDVMDALIELITSLAVSSGKFLDPCLTMLVSNFVPPYSKISKQRKEDVLGRVHSALIYISGLVPLAPSRLCPIISQRMPRPAQQALSVHALLMFVENILRLERSTIGELVGRSVLISAVVYLLIEFDVEIGWEDILPHPSKGIFELELEDEQIPDEDDEGEFGRESCGQKRLWKNEVSNKLEKLDNLMVLTFEHLQFCNNNDRLVQVFDLFLHSFQSTILTAFKSKFAQFVIFYACSLDPEHCGERFATLLAEIFVNRNFPLVTRMSAVAYLASYLARARFVQNASVMSSLRRIIKWCSDYSGSYAGVDFDPSTHRDFYSGCQAILYVLCFRMKSIMEIPALNSELSLLPLRQILNSPLKPLKVCLPSIVEEFMQQAESVNLLDESGDPVFDDMLESELSRAYGGTERLDAFFPFDPCLLRKCDSYIRPNFVYWSMVRKTYEEDDEGSSDEDEDGDVEVIYPDMNGDEYQDDGDFDEFNDTLNKMSITPRDSFLKSNMEMPSRLRPSMSPEFL